MSRRGSLSIMNVERGRSSATCSDRYIAFKVCAVFSAMVLLAVAAWRMLGTSVNSRAQNSTDAPGDGSGSIGGGGRPSSPSPPSSGTWKPNPADYTGIAKTTRYWDCCKGSCSWRSNVNNLASSASPVRTCSQSGDSANENDKNICGGGGSSVSSTLRQRSRRKRALTAFCISTHGGPAPIFRSCRVSRTCAQTRSRRSIMTRVSCLVLRRAIRTAVNVRCFRGEFHRACLENSPLTAP